MKIDQKEISEASFAYFEHSHVIPNSKAIESAIEAALKVRRARKQAKRERQRKEKDKQVVESVKPHNELRHAQIGRIIMKPKA